MKQIRDNIWQSISSSGPSVVVIGGMHGNELTGIEVVNQLVHEFVSGDRAIQRGSLTCILANPKAIVRGTRGSQDFADLNRMFNPGRFASAPDGSYEDARARELAPFLRQADVCIDLHSTNKPSVPFIPSRISPAHERIYRWFDSNIVVADPKYVTGGGVSATSDDFVDVCGGAGVAFESGQAQDLSRVPAVMQSVKSILCDLGLFDWPITAPQTTFETYELEEAIMLQEAGFRYADGLGEQSFKEVSVGQVIGWHGDSALLSSIDGVILFPKIMEHWIVGKPVGFLAKRTANR